MQPIDLFIGCYKREVLTRQTLKYLFERTTYPIRVFLLIQEDDKENNLVADEFGDKIFMRVNFSKNGGVHMLWNVAASLAESDFFITSDNDIFVPDLKEYLEIAEPHNLTKKFIHQDATNIKGDGIDWLGRMVKYILERPDYGAISLHPHVFIGAAGIDPTDPEDVKERNMCGAVMRIMSRNAVQLAGGWERKIEAGRNHEERTICSRLQTAGFKVGITSRIRAFHPFPPNWGYPPEFTPQMQKHTPELEPYVQQFNNMDAYDKNTWLPK